MENSSDRIIEQLVHQFDRPLDFYRELIQNSIDAGANRIDVSLDYDAAAGRAMVRVEDDGEGMDGRTLEDHFLVLFRSTKEGDFTKIGKFGVGIVSLFAFEPDLVRIHTGRHGESWRLDFKSWRRYDRYRADGLREGTLVELVKAMPRSEFAALVEDSRAAIGFWCRHADVRITFEDRSAAGGPSLLTEPFSLPHPESLRYKEEGTEAVLGFSPDEAPFFGFYNRGLTLKEGREAVFPGIEFKVKSRYFEHTLTRDNVLADDNYRKALEILRRLVEDEMPAKVRAEITALAARISAGEHPLKTEWARRLPYLRWLFARPPSRLRESQWPIFPALGGSALSWARVRAAVEARGGLLLHDETANPITRALDAAKVPVLVSGPWIPELRRWLGPGCRVARACEHYLRVAPLRDAAAPAALRSLLADLRALDAAAGSRYRGIHAADFDYPGSSARGRIFVTPEASGALVETAQALPSSLLSPDAPRRFAVLNVAHPFVRDLCAIHGHTPGLAGLLALKTLYLNDGRVPPEQHTEFCNLAEKVELRLAQAALRLDARSRAAGGGA